MAEPKSTANKLPTRAEAKATGNRFWDMSDYIASINKELKDRGITSWKDPATKVANKYIIPFNKLNQITLSKGRFDTGITTTDVLEEIAIAAEKAGLSLDEALGLKYNTRDKHYRDKVLKDAKVLMTDPAIIKYYTNTGRFPLVEELESVEPLFSIDLPDEYINPFFANGGHLFQEGGNGDILGLQVPLWAENVASFVPILGSAMDIKTAYLNPTLGNISTAALSVAGDLAGASLVRGAFKGLKAIDKFRKAEKAVTKLSKTAGKTEDYSKLLKALDELDAIKKTYFGGFDPDYIDYMLSDIPKMYIMGTDFLNNTALVAESHGIKKANGGYLPTLQDLERNNINYLKSTNNLPSVRYDNGGKLKSYNDLSMFEKNEVIATAVRNGLRDPEEIRRKYNEFINS